MSAWNAIPLPSAEVALGLSLGSLLGPVAWLALAAITTGFAVIAAGLIEEYRAPRPGAMPAGPGTDSARPARPSGRHAA